MNALKAFLIEKFGFDSDADKKAARQLAAERLAVGELSLAEIVSEFGL